ncbi:N-acetylmuramoyl-L-alanine amidase [Sediminitomix flava]|uniref:N-acetylmuramoyl-L-alanine amidase n=1 Tax=Sediminitomix flava TaxID=379075 RepID=A0A315ZF58_SEDFL|nr:N-acetylmuramoyl-L-alanine amidase [Sediminitomix flava]PWJ44185.1 N-acetylmuramoyl-L-alanine amidase [Sediminitomix flava]
MMNFQIDDNHRLEGKVTHLECSKNTKKFQQLPSSIILHYTAGRDALSSAKYLCKENIKASAHLVIGRKGEVIQLVPFNTISWHAGKSSYKGRNGFNNFSIGIEIDNAGPLEPIGQSYSAWFGKKYPATAVVKATHRNEKVERYWHNYTEKQIDTVEKICELLLATYPSIKEILGHEEISPGRKQDPGPAFPLDNLRSRLTEERDSEEAFTAMKAEVSVPLLNIREMPSIQAEKVMEPLPEGTRLKILGERDGWLKVRTQVEGWVASDYVDIV